MRGNIGRASEKSAVSAKYSTLFDYNLKDELLDTISKKTIRSLSLKLASAIHRCSASKNKMHVKHYQEKALEVCEAWKKNKFEFIWWASQNGFSEKNKYLDRIDNSKGYCPENCRFVDSFLNSQNREIVKIRNRKIMNGDNNKGSIFKIESL